MVHVLLCTDRQAQDRSFRQSRPHNPSLKHRNRQGNHWHTRHGKGEGQHGAGPVHPLTRQPGLEPLRNTSQHHTDTTRALRRHTHDNPLARGSGLTSPGPRLTARWAPEPRAGAWRVHQGLREMGFAGRRELGPGLSPLCPSGPLLPALLADLSPAPQPLPGGGAGSSDPAWGGRGQMRWAGSPLSPSGFPHGVSGCPPFSPVQSSGALVNRREALLGSKTPWALHPGPGF